DVLQLLDALRVVLAVLRDAGQLPVDQVHHRAVFTAQRAPAGGAGTLRARLLDAVLLALDVLELVPEVAPHRLGIGTLALPGAAALLVRRLRALELAARALQRLHRVLHLSRGLARLRQPAAELLELRGALSRRPLGFGHLALEASHVGDRLARALFGDAAVGGQDLPALAEPLEILEDRQVLVGRRLGAIARLLGFGQARQRLL